jgi:uncharacterized protein YvpB
VQSQSASGFAFSPLQAQASPTQDATYPALAPVQAHISDPDLAAQVVISRPARPAFQQHFPAVSPQPSTTPGPLLPEEYIIYGMRGHHQLLPIDCEAAAARDWARYFGVNIDEIKFQNRLPRSDNPDFGFVGDVHTVWGKLPPNGYGVYAGPLADLLNAYGLPAKAYKAYTLEQIKIKIAQNIPVIAWVTGNVEPGKPVSYTDSQGRTVIVAAFEHVVIITGYTKSHIRYMGEGITQFVPVKTFLDSWGVLGNMVVVDR